MHLIITLIGLAIGHVLVLSMVRNMRREGQHIRRFQVAGLVLAEMLVGVFVYFTGTWPVFVWMAVNASIIGLMRQGRPPFRPR